MDITINDLRCTKRHKAKPQAETAPRLTSTSQPNPLGMGEGFLKGGRLCSLAILRNSRNVNCST